MAASPTTTYGQSSSGLNHIFCNVQGLSDLCANLDYWTFFTSFCMIILDIILYFKKQTWLQVFGRSNFRDMDNLFTGRAEAPQTMDFDHSKTVL
ncbi:hypothetical protein M378DRAFT_401642 [Amanita muscaria Koide BX008]|uniref:Uncharacterized protein n=1 Tax=Amanita muscaria (strain Koide BX008) TaxID=946122 RepID=A0A0C2WWJ0_AMAMK|nr:hypothetical protein M378DRAFT_401642 [Amanita muscaria Koide BX008]